MELIARTEAILRRRATPPSPPPTDLPRRAPGRTPATIFEFGDIRVEPDARSVYRADRPVALRPREFDLLMALVRRGGAVASRLTLLNEVWGTEHDVLRRTVDTHIWELRRKLERDPTQPRHILTVRKTGYRLQP